MYIICMHVYIIYVLDFYIVADNSTGGSGNGAIDFVGLTIAVSVLGCLFGIALIVLLIYCCIVRKPYKLLRPKKYVHIVE